MKGRGQGLGRGAVSLDSYAYNTYTRCVRFEWDDAKGDWNPRKHGVSFDEAATTFYDPLATTHWLCSRKTSRILGASDGSSWSDSPLEDDIS